ncbi:MAG TPA: Gfo/Idh/MocA family oxidoreductase [Nitrososphaerales archaeon]|nr:Gfo/Idh/MocA family oxidoreductase [Nitrososphaerales archaeon]
MVRIAVIGTGGWGKNHVRVLSELGHLVAVCDLDASRATVYAEKYRVKGYSDVDEMLEKVKPDGVTICTPASTHFAVASKTLKAGVHTFVEKPMTSTVKEAQDLIKEAETAGKILTVGFIERFNPAISELKKMITEGTLGRPILFEYHRENRRGENIVDVGVVKDASVHDIDTARWLFGEEPKTVYARVGSVMGKNEDIATILLGFGEERTAFITTNWVTPSRVRQLSAVFEKAVVTLDFISQEIQVHEEAGTRVPKHAVQEPLMLELKGYATAIAEGRQPLVSGKDGLMVTRIAEAVLASSKTNSPIFVSANS